MEFNVGIPTYANQRIPAYDHAFYALWHMIFTMQGPLAGGAELVQASS